MKKSLIKRRLTLSKSFPKEDRVKETINNWLATKVNLFYELCDLTQMDLLLFEVDECDSFKFTFEIARDRTIPKVSLSNMPKMISSTLKDELEFKRITISSTCSTITFKCDF